MQTTLATPGPSLAGDRRILLGTAADLARALRVEPVTVRLCMLGAALSAPPLVLAYPLLTMVGAGRTAPRGRGAPSTAGVLGLLCIEWAAVLALFRVGYTLPGVLVLAVLAVQAVLTLAWAPLTRSERLGWLLSAADGGIVGAGRLRLPGGLVRVCAGAALALAGVWWLSHGGAEADWGAAVSAARPLGLVLAGLGLVFVPALLRLGTRVGAERRNTIRADERARMAAHLHDSVLQTLTLIQRSTDPAQTTALARAQERDLRDWLYGGAAGADAGRLRDRLTALCAEVEDRYRWRVELIVVGDADVGEREEELLAAIREAVVNAARHSGAAGCDLYAECGEDAVQVFVRDRGNGFDPDAVNPDRRGIAESIRARMARAGGTAALRTAPGAGAEVALRLPVGAGAASAP